MAYARATLMDRSTSRSSNRLSADFNQFKLICT